MLKRKFYRVSSVRSNQLTDSPVLATEEEVSRELRYRYRIEPEGQHVYQALALSKLDLWRAMAAEHQCSDQDAAEVADWVWNLAEPLWRDVT